MYKTMTHIFHIKNTNNRKNTFSSSDINLVKKFWPHDICTMISKKKFQSVNYLPESFRQQTMTQHVSFEKTKSRSATQHRVQIYCWPGLGCLQSFRQASIFQTEDSFVTTNQSQVTSGECDTCTVLDQKWKRELSHWWMVENVKGFMWLLLW